MVRVATDDKTIPPTDPTTDQEAKVKKLVKDALSEFLTENSPAKTRTESSEGQKTTRTSLWDMFGGQ